MRALLLIEGDEGRTQHLSDFIAGQGVKVVVADRHLVGEQMPAAQLFKVEGADHIFGAVYLINAKTILEQTLAARPSPQVFRVYLGYAGWTTDQLRNEVELGGWFIFPGDTGAIFNSDPGSLWPQMIGKTELKYAGIEPAIADPWIRTGPFVEMGRSSSLQQVAGP